MDKNKDQKYKKDTFDYDSIDESDIYDQKNKHESFILDETETARLQKFRINHSKCQFDEEGHYKFRPIGGSIDITFTQTGIGNILVCRCNRCHKYTNITNYDAI